MTSRARGVHAAHMMATRLKTILAATLVLTLGACSQIGSVTGSDRGARRISSAPTTMTSDVQYLGASADGMVLVRFPDGTVQGWRPNR